MATWKKHIDERKAISQRLELVEARLAQLRTHGRLPSEAEVMDEELSVLAAERERQTTALVARYEEHAEATYQSYLRAIRRSIAKRAQATITDESGRFTVSVARFGKNLIFALDDQGRIWVCWTKRDVAEVSVGQRQLLAKGEIITSVAKLAYAAETGEKPQP